MPIFICPTCVTIANTATDHYWREDALQESCTVCRSTEGIKAAVNKTIGWHNHFPRKKATGEWLININYLTDQFACERTPTADQLVGEALERGANKDNVSDIDFDNLETLHG